MFIVSPEHDCATLTVGYIGDLGEEADSKTVALLSNIQYCVSNDTTIQLYIMLFILVLQA
jgi:hypothetical protein